MQICLAMNVVVGELEEAYSYLRRNQKPENSATMKIRPDRFPTRVCRIYKGFLEVVVS